MPTSTVVYALGRFITVVLTALKHKRLVFTLPWILEFLSQGDQVTFHLSKFKPVLTLVSCIYRELLVLNPEGTEITAICLENKNFLRFFCGKLFGMSTFPDSYLFHNDGKRVQDFCRVPSSQSPVPDEEEAIVLDSKGFIGSTFTPIWFRTEMKQMRSVLTSSAKVKGNIPIASPGIVKHVRPIPERSNSSTSPGVSLSQSSPESSDPENRIADVQRDLEEQFFSIHPNSMKKTVEFVAERIASNFVKQLRNQILLEVKNDLVTKRIAQEPAVIECKEQIWQRMEDFTPKRCEETVNMLLSGVVSDGVLITCQAIATRKANQKIQQWVDQHITKELFPELNPAILDMLAAAASSAPAKPAPTQAYSLSMWLCGAHNFDQIQTELTEMLVKLENNNRGDFQLRHLVALEALRPTVVSLVLMFLQQIAGINAVIFYAAKIFKHAGSDMDPQDDIMSEQLADCLHVEEEEKYLKEIISSDEDEKEFVLPTELDLSDLLSSDNVDCSSDEVIATMLQMQFNKEYDLNLKKVEQKYNGASKISVSLSNYMVSPRAAGQPDSDSEEEEDEIGPKSKKPWDSFEANERAFPAMSSRGYVKVNNKVVTKHDVTMNGRRNACKVMESFPPCIHTGDGASFDMQLSNKVYNNLKSYSKAEENRRTRMHDKIEKSTSDMAIDTKTKLMLYKLINNGILDKVYGIVATGKESIVMFGTGGNTVETEKGVTINVPAECALKVFKTSLNEFKTRDKYIRDDYRFKDRFSKQNPQKVIRMWAEKEMHNLTRMSKAEIPCPQVVLLKKHILILGFIGKDMRPAPKLKDIKFPQDDNNALLLSAYNQTIEGMTNLYKRCNLIHGDLSEYNILWHENICYFIDVSQSVEPAHPNALEFLYRDCCNICTFFSKRRLDNIHTPESLFTEISGFELKDVNGPAVLDKIRSFEKNVEQLTFATSEKSYPFEYCWNQEQGEDSED